MTNEKEWWEESWKRHIGQMNDEGYDEGDVKAFVKEIVAESMRLGEVKAWEEASNFIERLDEVIGAKQAFKITELAFKAKLTSLKTP